MPDAGGSISGRSSKVATATTTTQKPQKIPQNANAHRKAAPAETNPPKKPTTTTKKPNNFFNN
jgi:hypothetical protein